MKSVFTKLLFSVIILSGLASCSNGEGTSPVKSQAIKRRLLSHADSVRVLDQASIVEDNSDDQ